MTESSNSLAGVTIPLDSEKGQIAESLSKRISEQVWQGSAGTRKLQLQENRVPHPTRVISHYSTADAVFQRQKKGLKIRIGTNWLCLNGDFFVL